MQLKMGTRGSTLALAQSGLFASALMAESSGLEVETVVIKTSGDRFALEHPQEALAPSGGKGLFVKEIEEALLRGDIDFAVHSAKDLPGEMPPGLCVAAYPQREDPWDVFIGRGEISWRNFKPHGRLGTASLRRKVQLLESKPGLEVVALRGNVDTRLRKLQEGQVDGLVLALAGLKRLGRGDIAYEVMPQELILPAPGQGALAVQARNDRGDILDRLRLLDHAPTRLEVEFERSLMRALGGDCSTPLGALARAQGTAVQMSAFWALPDGSGARRLAATCPDPTRREEFIESLAGRLAH